MKNSKIGKTFPTPPPTCSWYITHFQGLGLTHGVVNYAVKRMMVIGS